MTRRIPAVCVAFVLLVGATGCSSPFKTATGTQTRSTETVSVQYRGQVALASFECDAFSRSSLVRRLCYDAQEEYLLVSLNGTYYHYCEVPRAVATAWKNAQSLGQFYNQQVKGRFDCRVYRMPSYER